MPRVKIGHAYSVYVEIEAGEASITELRAAAREEFEHAVQVTAGLDHGNDHRPAGFAPVKAGGDT